ncbi:glutathione S-transferase N-terminal domain-containing protein [Alloalcanivorax mobilis]|uniref:glutathione S-transferase N-terminal domain-containing protein n=1 Tax=Alloalcanivorax mobilis TaxID=2019569 RepID=UPI0018E442A6|nr:glutathione S-transferase [Alloalcanivorax mobilis]
MQSQRVVWGRRSAFNVQKVLWLLDELALAYQHRDAGGEFGGLDEPAFLALNPHGRVPVLQDGAVVVWESHAILRYLAAQYGDADLWGPSPAQRSLADRWMDWSQTTLQPAFMALFAAFYRTPAEHHDARRIAEAVAECERHFELLAGWRPLYPGGRDRRHRLAPLF